MGEHAETMAAEGVGSLEDLRLVTQETQLQALGNPRSSLAVDAQTSSGLQTL